VAPLPDDVREDWDLQCSLCIDLVGVRWGGGTRRRSAEALSRRRSRFGGGEIDLDTGALEVAQELIRLRRSWFRLRR
jgi:hypothetical protein